MKKTIFYSWQSDLPNRSNRGFLEKCLKESVKKLSKISLFSIELTVDRDTKNLDGTPDIVNSILGKIERSSLFVADISIINSDSIGRKTPNPNVLFELGYAVKTLGWDRVICIFNLDYGSIDDLPFDLRQKRILTYSLDGEKKKEVEKKIIDIISKSVINLNENGLLDNIISDYFKVQVDTEILTCINHLNKIINGYNEINSLKKISDFMHLQRNQIKELLSERNFLGFQIFKKFEVNEKKLRELVDKSISATLYEKEIVSCIIELLKWVGSFDSFCTDRVSPYLFLEKGNKNELYRVVSGYELNTRNTKFLDRYILVEKINREKGKVIDFGDFQEKYKIDGLLKEYAINIKYLESYSDIIFDFIKISNKWLELTNGEFIIDNIKSFVLKSVK